MKNLDELNEEVWEAYEGWATAQRDYLETTDNLHEAKFRLSRAIDAAYANGEVVGKNEREREANLRVILPQAHADVDDLERKSRLQERILRDAEVRAERVKLQVGIALGSIALIR